MVALYEPPHELLVYGSSVPDTDHPDYYSVKTSRPKNKQDRNFNHVALRIEFNSIVGRMGLHDDRASWSLVERR